MARPLNDSTSLYGFHDPGGESIMADAGIFGWILFTEAIGSEPNDMSGKDFSQWANRGFGIMVRINNGYAPGGTIPHSSRYSDFAKRCANYVRNSTGAHIWIIGNEMNHPIERPGIRMEGDRLVNPGESITPSLYANCYRQCRAAIKAVPGREADQVIVGGVAPWNPSTVYDGNPSGDWCKYLTDILTILGPTNCDGIAIHAYTHGSNPELIYNDYKMNPPFQNRQYNFRVYRDFMEAIPASMRSLPVYLTETDQDDAWFDANNGWVQRAYGEIDAWNKTQGTQKIRAVLLYRWPRHDKWYIDGKSGVISDFKQAMTFKYTWDKLVTVPPDTAPILFPETGKTAKGAFAAFYRKYGLEITGFPITEEYTAADSGLKTQDWQRVIMEEYPANGGQIRLRLAGVELAELRKQVTALQLQVARLEQEIARLQQGGGGGPAMPAITDITTTLPRNPAGFVKRPLADIKNIVINHTAVRPEVGADRVAAAHIKKWPGIVGHFFITADGQIQQTNPIDEVVTKDQAWIYNGISIYVAGNFDDTVPTTAQLDALAQLCAWLMSKHSLPIGEIKGAQELVVTGSPGKQWLTGQNWKTMLLDKVKAIPVSGGTKPPDSTELVALRAQVAALQSQLQTLNGQIASLLARNADLQAQLDALKAGNKIAQPSITDVSAQLPRNPGSLKPRPLDQIKYVVLNHTAVDPSVGVDRLAAAHQKRWGAILYQYFIGADGTILQTNPLDQSVDLTQPWPGQAVNIAIAGDFTAQVPTDAQLAAAGHLSAWLLQELKLPVDAVKGASELIPTQSPGTQWLQGQNWKSLLLTRIADVQKAAGPGAPIDSATVQALRAQVSQLQQALSLAQASIAALTVERDQLRTQLSQVPDVTRLNQQIQDLTRQLQTANADKAALAQQLQALANDKSALSQQLQTLTAEKAQLTQQMAVLNQTIADLRRQLGGGSSTVPVPAIKDVTDSLPKHATNRYSTRSLDKITHITIHHSAAPANIPVETIAAYHVNNNDWPGIGYHFCIGPDGTIYQVNRLETVSYHAGVVNDYTIGICLEGDFRNGLIPTPKQIESAGHLSAWLSQKLKIPVANIMGHKEYPKNATECPGDDWAAGQNWKELLHKRVEAVLAGNLTPPAKTIGHYVLFWQRADNWAKEDYAAAANYVARFRPTHGFTPEDARNAEYVTIVGGPAGVSPAIEQMLRDAGCKVERLAGKDFADTKRMLDDLAQRGQRFQTFNM